jgi:cysteine synthase A
VFASPVDSLVDAIGGTPVVALSRLGVPDGSAPRGSERAPSPRAWIGLKLESLNPTGAAQDRLARALVLEGERGGLLRPGEGRVIEAGSGNLAVSLAMV